MRLERTKDSPDNDAVFYSQINAQKGQFGLFTFTPLLYTQKRVLSNRPIFMAYS